MPDPETLDERLRAVERALTDADRDLTDLRDAAALADEIETLRGRLDDAEDRLDELDAATQALRGYVGNVRAVNESVERRADAALAKAESLERGAPGAPPADRDRCDCERRRPDPAPDSPNQTDDDEDPPSETEPGPLARLAGALR